MKQRDKRWPVRVLLAVLALIFLVIVVATVAWAGGYSYPTPPRSAYHSSVYISRYPMRFYLNDGISTQYIGSTYAYLFNGMGVVGINDASNSIKAKFLDLLRCKNDGAYYLINDFAPPVGNISSYGSLLEHYCKSMMDSYVHQIVDGNAPTSGSGTPSDPYVYHKDGQPADVTYDGTNYAYAKSLLPAFSSPTIGKGTQISKKYSYTGGDDRFVGGWTSLSSPYGARSVSRILKTSKGKEYTDVLLNDTDIFTHFNYDLGITALTRDHTGTKPGDTEKWHVTYFNTTPYVTDAKNTTFRAYILTAGSTEPQLVASGNHGIGSYYADDDPPSAAYFNSHTRTWSFSYPLPASNFTLYVTLDERWDPTTNTWALENFVAENPVAGYAQVYPGGHLETTYADNRLSANETLASN